MKQVQFNFRCTSLIWLLAIAMTLFGLVNSSAQKKKEIQWMGFEQLEDSLNIASKKVWISFYADWCVYCKKMDATAYSKSDIIDDLQSNFYTVKMDAETEDTISFEGQVFVNRNKGQRTGRIHDLALLLGSREDQPYSLPVTILLDEDFKVLERHFTYLSPKEMKKIISKYKTD